MRACAISLIIFEQPRLGIVSNRISHLEKGRVKFDGTSWPGTPCQEYSSSQEHCCIEAGTKVWIIGRQGLTLLVKPVTQPAANSYPKNNQSTSWRRKIA